jgi:hypothetical protein
MICYYISLLQELVDDVVAGAPRDLLHVRTESNETLGHLGLAFFLFFDEVIELVRYRRVGGE